MNRFKISVILAFLVLTITLGGCVTDKYGLYDGHGNRGDDVVR
ncbi:MAG: hypothetical protein ACKVOI_14730 [Dongiaceae bacterium]